MEWRNIPSLSGYEASDTGMVRSVDRMIEAQSRGKTIRRLLRGVTLAQFKSGSEPSYMAVGIHGRMTLVHALVLEAFKGPRPKGYQCRHLNGNPLDNRACNLEWGTCSQNQLDRRKHGTANTGSRNWAHKFNWEQVRAIRKAVAEGPRGTQSKLAAQYGVTKGQISNIVKGRNWQE